MGTKTLQFIAATLLLAAPAAAQTSSGHHSFPWGVLGVIGLIGLFGRKRS